MLIQIKHRWTGAVLYEGEHADVREAVVAAVVGASLRGARLRGARLDGASLDGASLVGASLDGASLDGASLDGASLDGASLRGASLVGASLDPIKKDLWRVFDASPGETHDLRLALVEGRVDGSTYEGPCCCLVGTLAAARGCRYDAMPGLYPNASRSAEKWFLAIRPGMSIDHPVVAITLGWIDEWMEAKAKAPDAPVVTS